MDNSEMSIKILDMNDADLKQLLNIGFDIIRFYEARVAKAPPQGAAQIVLFQGPPGPRALNLMHYKSYFIRVNLKINIFTSAQFVWQFAHEVGHLYQRPSNLDRILEANKNNSKSRWSNFFTESFCTAMSYICLSQLNKEQTFEIYRRIQIDDALRKAGIEFHGELSELLMERIKSELPSWFQMCSVNNRPQQGACALLIEQALLKYPNAWGAQCYLGDVTENFETNFDQWQRMVDPKQRPLVKALASMFRA